MSSVFHDELFGAAFDNDAPGALTETCEELTDDGRSILSDVPSIAASDSASMIAASIDSRASTEQSQFTSTTRGNTTLYKLDIKETRIGPYETALLSFVQIVNSQIVPKFTCESIKWSLRNISGSGKLRFVFASSEAICAAVRSHMKTFLQQAESVHSGYYAVNEDSNFVPLTDGEEPDDVSGWAYFSEPIEQRSYAQSVLNAKVIDVQESSLFVLPDHSSAEDTYSFRLLFEVTHCRSIKRGRDEPDERVVPRPRRGGRGARRN